MRIRSVRIRAFGSLAERSLELSAGMNVISGENESGKSTWCAAIYAAVCGVRRGPGRRREESEFRRRRRPWNGDAWAVQSCLELADGRVIEITQDLEGRVDCRAVDVGLGRRDVSAEIMFEGSPDASRWLGLDRRSFLATACVGQAEVLAVMDSAEALQEHLQRAAATAGADETAARALALIDEFQREQVGTERSGAVKPLRRALDAVEHAARALEQARLDHRAYLQRLAEAERLDGAAVDARRRLEVLTAAAAKRRAGTAQAAAARARFLEAKLAGGPADPAPLQAAAEHVSAAIGGWLSSPVPEPLEGATAEELANELGRLPAPPGGDLEPAPPVVEAETAWRAARVALEAQAAAQPARAGAPATSVPPWRLREMARDLATPVPEVDPGLRARQAELRRRLEAAGRRRPSLPLLIAAAAVAAAGVGAGLLVSPPAIVAGLLVGAGLAALGLRRALGGRRAALLEKLRQVESGLGGAGAAREAAQARVGAAVAYAAAQGLPSHPAGLLAVAAGVESALRAEESWLHWRAAYTEQWRRHDEAQASLRALLAGRGWAETPDLAAAVSAYRQDCSARAAAAREAARRPDLERALAVRRHAEAAAAEAREKRGQAGDRLLAAARERGLAAADPAAALAALRAWQGANRLEMEDTRARAHARGELDSLLAGGTPDGLVAAAERETAAAAAAARELPAGEVAAAAAAGDLPARLDEARLRAEDARAAAALARGELAALAAAPASVSGCEEALAAAQTELDRVRRLEATLVLTREHLVRAQERVHRDVAPVLERTLGEWLPRVTAGRYTDASVDPATLEVRLKDPEGEFREAGLLSQGTREQAYLLLRMALVTHLTRPSEVAPLILDDVTVQTDAPRTHAILELLHEVSAGRQVIVFSQEEAVRRWAEATLEGGRDRLLVLDGARA